MINYIRICYFISLALIYSNNSAIADDTYKNLNYNYKQFNSIVLLGIGAAFAANTKDYFERYSEILDGKKQQFQQKPIFSFSSKFQFWKKIRVGILAEYFEVQLSDYYTQDIKINFQSGIRHLTQNINIESIPLFLIIEYVPLVQQFRTYTGFGAGAVFSDITWNETISTSLIFDKRKSSTPFDDLVIHPAFILYGGLELGFDKVYGEDFLGSLNIELKYTYMYRNIPFFFGIKEQFVNEEAPERINEEFTILSGYIGLYIGVTFNFNRR